MTRKTVSSLWGAGVLLAGLSACHDAVRENPLDPVLGRMHLPWSRYRDPGFVDYQVWRRASGLEEEKLAVLADVGDTSFVDQTARAGEFAFGDGTRVEGGLNYGGSLCVDEAGYIYVADPFNRRIEKFAP